MCGQRMSNGNGRVGGMSNDIKDEQSVGNEQQSMGKRH